MLPRQYNTVLDNRPCSPMDHDFFFLPINTCNRHDSLSDKVTSQWILSLFFGSFLMAFKIFCRYLSALISQSFLDIGSVSRILDSIMKLCLQFCWSIENQESPNPTELDQITEVTWISYVLLG